MKKTNGLSFTLVFGTYGGFHILWQRKTTGSVRICLGWVALTMYLYDMENAISNLLKSKDKTEQSEVNNT